MDVSTIPRALWLRCTLRRREMSNEVHDDTRKR